MTKTEIEDAQSKRIRKSNELVQRARFKLSVPAQKVLLYLISRINPSDIQFRVEEFAISDLIKICRIEDSGRNYEIIKDALSELVSNSARVWIKLSCFL